jgi:hypothetical protein
MLNCSRVLRAYCAARKFADKVRHKCNRARQMNVDADLVHSGITVDDELIMGITKSYVDFLFEMTKRLSNISLDTFKQYLERSVATTEESTMVKNNGSGDVDLLISNTAFVVVDQENRNMLIVRNTNSKPTAMEKADLRKTLLSQDNDLFKLENLRGYTLKLFIEATEIQRMDAEMSFLD